MKEKLIDKAMGIIPDINKATPRDIETFTAMVSRAQLYSGLSNNVIGSWPRL